MNDVSVVILVPVGKVVERNIEKEQTAVHEPVEDVENSDSSDEFIETLLRRAEENLASTESSEQEPIKSRIRFDPLSIFAYSSLNPGPLPKPYLEMTKNGNNKLLTDQLEDSVIITSHNGTVQRLSAPLSKKQKEKVSPLPSFPPVFDDVIFVHFSGAMSRITVLASYCTDDSILS